MLHSVYHGVERAVCLSYLFFTYSSKLGNDLAAPVLVFVFWPRICVHPATQCIVVAVVHDHFIISSPSPSHNPHSLTFPRLDLLRFFASSISINACGCGESVCGLRRRKEIKKIHIIFDLSSAHIHIHHHCTTPYRAWLTKLYIYRTGYTTHTSWRQSKSSCCPG